MEVGTLQQKILRYGQDTTVLAQNFQFTDFQLKLYQNHLGVPPKFGTIF